MGSDFARLAVVNRGTAGIRCINAVAEYNHERATAIRTIAVFSGADRASLFAREADEAVCVPAGALRGADAVPGAGAYGVDAFDIDALAHALHEHGVDAVWLGWGRLSEHAAFARRCDELGIMLIGPTPAAIARLADKVAAKQLAERAGVEVVPWSGELVDTLDAARLHAARLGYPVLVKAATGDGALGLRTAWDEHGIDSAFTAARAEAAAWFGDSRVFLERRLTAARHVEVQVVADRVGTVWTVDMRDCTVQRAHRKVVEETAVLTADVEERIRSAAERICRAAQFSNVGTVEFLAQAGEPFAFVEANPRLQVEHALTELTTGVDLVKLQLDLARGELPRRLVADGARHAVEVRLCAEDPERDFAPSTGSILVFRTPTGPGVRVDAGVAQHDDLSSGSDPLLATICVWGGDRNEALARAARAVEQSNVVVRGGATNKGFLLDILRSPEFRSGEYDTEWMDRRLRVSGRARPEAWIALVQAAIEAYEHDRRVDQARFYATAARGRPEVQRELSRVIELRRRDHEYRLRVRRRSATSYVVELDGDSVDVRVEQLGEFERRLTIGRRPYRAMTVTHGPDIAVDVDGQPFRFSRDEGGIVRSAVPAVVVSIMVAAGDVVGAGDTVAVVETMKMETRLTAPFAGRVRTVFVTPNTHIDAGSPLVQLDVVAHDVVSEARRIHLDIDASRAPVAPGVYERAKRVFDVLRARLLGFDVDDAELRSALGEYAAACEALAADDPFLKEREEQLLELFVALCSLTRRQPDPDREPDADASPLEFLLRYLRRVDRARDEVPPQFLERLSGALAHYDVAGPLDRTAALDDALYWLFRAHVRLDVHVPIVVALLERRLAMRAVAVPRAGDDFRLLLDRVVYATDARFPSLNDLARTVRHHVFDEPLLAKARAGVERDMHDVLERLAARPDAPERSDWVRKIVQCPQPLHAATLRWARDASLAIRQAAAEIIVRRYYRIRQLDELEVREVDGIPLVVALYVDDGEPTRLVAVLAPLSRLEELATSLQRVARPTPYARQVVVELHFVDVDDDASGALEPEIDAVLAATDFDSCVRRVVVSVVAPPSDADNDDIAAEWSSPRAVRFLTFSRHKGDEHLVREDHHGLHPMMAERIALWRLENFALERLPSRDDVFLFRGVAHENAKDERLFAIVEVRDLTPVRDDAGRVVALPLFERMLTEALTAVRRDQSHRSGSQRLPWNRIIMYVRPPWTLTQAEMSAIIRRIAPETVGAGLEKLVVHAQMPDPNRAGSGDSLHDMVIHVANPFGRGVEISYAPPRPHAIRPLSEYLQRAVLMRRRGFRYPYEVVRTLAPEPGSESMFPSGDFIEYDLDGDVLVPIDRRPGKNAANLVVGIIRNITEKYPEGMRRVILLGDPSRNLGALAEPECRRINAALDLAEQLGLPVEWFALSSGARIAMDSGTENMDWIAAVLRRLIEFTQRGGEVNVVVTGINVGAQPYWNAEATMLLHTKGILVMTPESAMVLTGKQALDYSGGVSAEDNFGIGGYERVMGPNGQAQYWAPDLEGASRILFAHYDHAYRAPQERYPRRAVTSDPYDRDVQTFPHSPVDGTDFTVVGDVFSHARNPGRKQPFDMRSVMRSVTDLDREPLERWARLADGDTSIVWDAHIGGMPVCLLGFESHQLTRHGLVPADGPQHWTSGTLFPVSSKKTARAINAASGNRPLVVLANLSGFDGSPESMRRLQLEYGAEIGRAITNFDGPIVFCVVSRYHGGAFVVFSKPLNERVEIAAVEGSYASVIGGAPAAAVVFARDVDDRTAKDVRVVEAKTRLAAAQDNERAARQTELDAIARAVRSEKLGEVADEFDHIHTIERAQAVGSVDRIIPPAGLRPYLIDALERGMARDLDGRRPEPVAPTAAIADPAP